MATVLLLAICYIAHKNPIINVEFGSIWLYKFVLQK